MVLMTWVGYTGNAAGETMAVATNIRYLVAAMFFTGALFMFIGLALINNMSKKNLTRMYNELNTRKAAN